MRQSEDNVLCWCDSGKRYEACHRGIEEKILSYEQKGYLVPELEMLRTEKEIRGIRESGRRNAAILDAVGERICVGMKTEEIDRLVREQTEALGGIPAPLGYDGYLKSCCTSLNSQVCHGIPSDSVILKEGDIINVDVSTIYKGYFSDSSRMFCVGEVSEEAQRLVQIARECVEQGIARVRPWGLLGDMAEAVHSHAKKHGYTVVEEMGGHGIGLEFHTEPFVSYIAPAGTEMLMVPGMVFTIEPMINQGTAEIVLDEKNGWTARTADGKLSAQWEVTVAVTETGCEVLAW